MLHEYLDSERNELEKSLAGSGKLIDYIRLVIDSGGKRLRPFFCYLGYVVGGGEPSTPLLRVAASLELLHTFAIIHDDLMDRAEERRGSPALNRVIGEAMAILVGDLALVLADDLFFASGFDRNSLDRALPYLFQMKKRAAAGQYGDLIAAPADDPERAMEIARLKTGSYTVEGPLLVGAALAEASDEINLALMKFGERLGEAFQLHDDIDGVFAETPSMEKGRANLLMAETFARSSTRQRELLLDPASDPKLIRELTTSTGALAAMDEKLRSLAVEAEQLLDPLQLAGDRAHALIRLKELAAIVIQMQ